MISFLRILLLCSIFIELSHQKLHQIDVVSKLSAVNPDCQTKTFFKDENQHQLFIDDLNKFCSLKSSASDINTESKVLCRMIYSSLKKACSLPVEDRLQIKSYDKQISAEKVCSSKSVALVNPWILRILGVNQTSSFGLNEQTLCQQLSNNTQFLPLVRFFYKLSYPLVNLGDTPTISNNSNSTLVSNSSTTSATNSPTNSATSSSTTSTNNKSNTVPPSTTPIPTTTSLSNSSATGSSTINSAGTTVQAKAKDTVTNTPNQSTTMANKPSTTNVGKTASPVLDLSENKPNLSSTTKAVETKEQEEQAEKDEDEQEEQDEEQRPSDKDEQEHGGPADPVDEDRLANKEQENKDNGQDENKVNDKHQEETSVKSIDQATSKSVDEVDQYQVEDTDQLNEDQEDDSPTDVEPNADIDQPEREDDEDMSISKTTDLDTEHHQGRVPSDQDRERQHHEDGHGHREPSRFRPSNPEPNAQRVPKRKYSEEEGSSSNFLTYFLLLTLLFVVGYLILHNKNKVLGLLIEGWRMDRHSQGRRFGTNSSSARYQRISQSN